MNDDILKIIKDLKDRIEVLERHPASSFYLPNLTADPTTGQAGQMYYNTVTGKYRKYDAVAGAWKNFESA